MKLRTLLVLLAAVSATAMAVTVLLPDPPEVRRGPNRPGASSTDRAEDITTRAANSRGAKGASERGESPSELASGRPSAPLEILVRETDGREIAGAALRVESEIGPHLRGFELVDERDVHVDATTDERGRARFEALPVGPYAIVAESADRGRVRHEFVLALERTQAEVVFPEHPAWRDLLVRVVDPDGAPVAAVHVEVFGGVVGSESAAVAEKPALEGTTDAKGIARFQDVEYEGGAILATDEEGHCGLAQVGRKEDIDRAMDAGGIVLTLSDPGVLEGALTGFPPERFLEACVIALALDDPDPDSPTPGGRGAAVSTPIVDGKYRFGALPAGTWTLSLSDPGGGRLVLRPNRSGPSATPNSVDPIAVVVEAGATSSRDLEVTEGGSIEGRVVTEKGDEVADALVRDTCAPSSPLVPDGLVIQGVHVWRFDSRARGDHPVTHPSTRTDSGGRYRLLGLQPGLHRIEVLASGLSYDRREGVQVEDGKRTNLEHVLEPAGAIQGVEPRAGFLGVAPEGRDEEVMIAALPKEGGFTFAGLASGKYVLAEVHPDPAVPRVPLATVAVVPGHTTWIDLSRADRPVRLRGRVLDGRGAVSGVRVRVYPEALTTDAEGQYQMRASYPLSGRISVQVLRDAVETWFTFPGTPDGATSFEKDLRLGDEAIRVRTRNESGAPAPARLEISAVNLHSPPADVETIRFEPIFVDEAGERSVSGLLPGEYTVRARFENGSEIQGSVSVPKTSALELRMPPSSVLTVLVREPEGHASLGTWISVETWIDGRPAEGSASPTSDPEVRWGETDVDGRATFRGVRAGKVLIRIRSAPGARSGLESVLVEERLTLAAGEEKSIELQLPER